MKTALQLNDEIHNLQHHIYVGEQLAKEGYPTEALNAPTKEILKDLKQQYKKLMEVPHMKVIDYNKKDKLAFVIEETEDAYLLLPSMLGGKPERILKTDVTVVADFTVFYSRYEDKWDYMYAVCERGYSLGMFINDKRPDYQWMFDQPQPVHFSEIPKEIQQEYKDWLMQWMADEWDIELESVSYTELDAAIGDYENYDWEREQDEQGC